MLQLFNTPIIPASIDAGWATTAPTGLLPKPVLVICHPTEAGNGEQEQLTTLLTGGCKLTADQYNIVTFDADTAKWPKLRDAGKPKIVLLIGLSPEELGIVSLFRFNEVNRFDGCLWVPTPRLGQLIQDKQLKVQLWNNALKPLFETKTYGNLLVS